MNRRPPSESSARRSGKSGKSGSPDRSPDGSPTVTSIRIVGGKLRGRKIQYSGEERTRPMKDRAREAVFNLVGPSIKGTHAIDLFSGTGALALEAVSRGSVRATAIERHFPTAKMVTENAKLLGIADKVEVVPGDTFIWARRLPDLGPEPWVVFCSPPYALYQDRREDMLRLLTTLIEAAPAKSQFVVESDANFDWDAIPKFKTGAVSPADSVESDDADSSEIESEWDIRNYHPAVVGIWKKPDFTM